MSMSQLILTDEMRSRLAGVKEKMELRDASGNLIGYFEPLPAQGGWGPFTAEEVETAFRQTGPGRTLDEILKDAGLR
jgi:hypothetical protein